MPAIWAETVRPGLLRCTLYATLYAVLSSQMLLRHARHTRCGIDSVAGGIESGSTVMNHSPDSTLLSTIFDRERFKDISHIYCRCPIPGTCMKRTLVKTVSRYRESTMWHRTWLQFSNTFRDHRYCIFEHIVASSVKLLWPSQPESRSAALLRCFRRGMVATATKPSLACASRPKLGSCGRPSRSIANFRARALGISCIHNFAPALLHLP
eukprot:4763958-Pleurochrysis_carterae.AAC.5